MSGGGFAYFWRSYTSTISGSIEKRVRCVGCSRVFSYIIKRTAAGGGHSPLFLANAGAAEKARQRARTNLDRALSEGVDPVHCPGCGIYQPEMVQVLRKEFGKDYEPNIWAKMRLAMSPIDTWAGACEANTIRSYTNFMLIWPMYSAHAKKKINELKYPPHLRKLFRVIAWAAWGGLILFVFYIIAAER
jgi:hypothetical protein